MKQTQREQTLRRQRGEGLMSYFLYLGLIAFVIGGYYAWKNSSDVQNQNQGELNHILAIQQCIRNNRDANGYADESLATLQTTSCLPSDMVGYTSGTLMSSFNQPVTITTTTSNYTITFEQVPAKNCQSITNALSLAGSTNFTNVTTCSTSGPTDLAITGV